MTVSGPTRTPTAGPAIPATPAEPGVGGVATGPVAPDVAAVVADVAAATEVTEPARRPRHLLDVASLGRHGVLELIELARTFTEVSEREVPKVPALRGRTVVSMFFEDSTRTRLSFETAARRLSADVTNLAAGSSSLSKGESLRDTVETVLAMGVDALVVRHRSSGASHQVARWCDELGERGTRRVGPGRTRPRRPVAVLNAGDGCHQHPTQALLDCYSVLEGLGRPAGADLSGLRVVIVGDVRHSRVARSDVEAFGLLGAEVTLAGPPTLMPPSVQGWGVGVCHDVDDALAGADVVGLLRLQRERMSDGLVPSVREYASTYGLSADRARRLGDDVLILHPGPVNRGVEIADEVTDHPGCLIADQVRNGVAVRMAAMFWLLGGTDVT